MKCVNETDTSNLYKDMYLYIAKLADDKTVINMLSVNKKFRDPVFFETIFKEKYPWLIAFKPDNVDWKMFYLEMVHYLSKLEEEYGITYYPSADFHPKYLYDFLNKNPNEKEKIKNNKDIPIIFNTRLLQNGEILPIVRGELITNLNRKYKLPKYNFYPISILINPDTENWLVLQYDIKNNIYIANQDTFPDYTESVMGLYTFFVDELYITLSDIYDYLDDGELRPDIKYVFEQNVKLEVEENVLEELGYKNSTDLLEDLFYLYEGEKYDLFFDLLHLQGKIILIKKYSTYVFNIIPLKLCN